LKTSKKIEEELMSYITFCKKINWKEVLHKYGTDKYKKMLKEQPLEADRCGVNPRLTRTLFDVVHWWRDRGCKLFPRLAVAALIVLAKVAHNGFQERVFSIGTFLDTKQQKRRQERHYEMDVLQRINSDLLLDDDFYDSMQMKQAPGESDKEKLDGFFKLTEEIQEKHAATAKLKDSEMEDVPLESDEDEVSEDVPLQKDEGDEDENMGGAPEWHDLSSDESNSE
jgi:hypothetical protein